MQGFVNEISKVNWILEEGTMPFLEEIAVAILNLPNECVPTSDVTEFKTR